MTNFAHISCGVQFTVGLDVPARTGKHATQEPSTKSRNVPRLVVLWPPAVVWWCESGVQACSTEVRVGRGASVLRSCALAFALAIVADVQDTAELGAADVAAHPAA